MEVWGIPVLAAQRREHGGMSWGGTVLLPWAAGRDYPEEGTQSSFLT